MFSSLFGHKPSPIQIQIDLLGNHHRQKQQREQHEHIRINDSSTADQLPLFLSNQSISGHIKLRSLKTIHHHGIQIELIGEMNITNDHYTNNSDTTKKNKMEETTSSSLINRRSSKSYFSLFSSSSSSSASLNDASSDDDKHTRVDGHGYTHQFTHSVQVVSGSGVIHSSEQQPDTVLFFHFSPQSYQNHYQVSKDHSHDHGYCYESYYGKWITCRYYLMVKVLDGKSKGSSGNSRSVRTEQQRSRSNSNSSIVNVHDSNHESSFVNGTSLISSQSSAILHQCTREILVQCINDPNHINHLGNHIGIAENTRSDNGSTTSCKKSDDSKNKHDEDKNKNEGTSDNTEEETTSNRVALRGSSRLQPIAALGYNSLSKDKQITLEVGLGNDLHFVIKLYKMFYHVNDVLLGKIVFVRNIMHLKRMEIGIIRRERVFQRNGNDLSLSTGALARSSSSASLFDESNSVSHEENGPTTVNDDSHLHQSTLTYETNTETLSKFEIMDGDPCKNQMVPIRLYLAGIPHLTPSYAVKNMFDVTYFVNVCLIDSHDRRLFKQQEIYVYRKEWPNWHHR